MKLEKTGATRAEIMQHDATIAHSGQNQDALGSHPVAQQSRIFKHIDRIVAGFHAALW